VLIDKPEPAVAPEIRLSVMFAYLAVTAVASSLWSGGFPSGFSNLMIDKSLTFRLSCLSNPDEIPVPDCRTPVRGENQHEHRESKDPFPQIWNPVHHSSPRSQD
jgi:hypothetical protein